MSLTKIKGQNFRAFVGGSAIPEESNCQISITGNMEDSKTKDSEGSFNQEQMVSRSWSVQVDSYQATAAELIAVINQFLSDETVQVGWDQTNTTSGTQNRTPSNAAFARSICPVTAKKAIFRARVTVESNFIAPCVSTSQ